MIDSITIADLFMRWDIPWFVTFALAILALVYMRGWKRIRCTRPKQFGAGRLIAFLAGIAALFVAVASPLDTLSESLLIMHMAQHFVLMSVAPPLIVLGAPGVPLLRGLPRWMIHDALGPLFTTRGFSDFRRFLTRPRVAWLAMNLSYIGWHIPRAYEFALASENWHNFEHACFFFTNLMFWWTIIRPWPSRRLSSRWVLIPYLLLSDVVNTGISSFLCFSGRLLYPSYDTIARPFGLSALNDQVAAGAFMWVCGSMVFLLPVFGVIMQLLSSAAVSGQTFGEPDSPIEVPTYIRDVNGEAI